MSAEAVKLVNDWNEMFVQAMNFDSWGQMVEAADEYTRLASIMKSSLIAHSQLFDENKSKVIRKVASCLQVRSKTLQLMKAPADIELAEIKQLGNVMRNLLHEENPEIPQEITHQMRELDIVCSTPSPVPDGVPEERQSVSQLNSSSFNSLLPRLPLEKDTTLVTVNIIKIGLKNAASHIDPFFIINCKDVAGVDLCKPQRSPIATKRDETYLYFDVNVELQVYLERLPRNAAVFFELKHYKPAKRSTSTKCFAFMEQDELKNGPCVIELYKKPIDFRRRKLALLTSKPLYLHLNLTLHTS